jgi:GntR family transcriptional regulator, transcriptional repressor for pyruvate dehydrogenase complex
MAARSNSRRRARSGIPIRFSLLAPEEGALLEPSSATEAPRSLKTSEIVAQRIVEDIVAGNMQIGDRLPPESEMVEGYGVSRESVREGLRLLEVQGLITLRRGPGGGPVVTSVDPRNLARTSTLYFHLAGANYNELFDTWLLLEPVVVRQVTETIDRAAKKRALAPFLPDYDPDVDRDRFMSRSNGFHAVISTMSNNRVLTMLLQALSHIVVEHIVRDLDPLVEQQEISDDHVLIAQAMIDGRATRAQRLMTEHIEHLVDYYRKHFPDKVDEYVQWR